MRQASEEMNVIEERIAIARPWRKLWPGDRDGTTRNRPLLADEAAALSRAMERLPVEPDLRSRLAAGCAAVTYRTGWDKPVKQLCALLASGRR